LGAIFNAATNGPIDIDSSGLGFRAALDRNAKGLPIQFGILNARALGIVHVHLPQDPILLF
jgi:hypothetical protein